MQNYETPVIKVRVPSRHRVPEQDVRKDNDTMTKSTVKTIKAPKKASPSQVVTPDVAPQMEVVGMAKFRRNLRQARLNKGLSMSELARSIWGETTDSRGYTVALHRDRITKWESGAQVPTPANLAVLAAALEMTVEELAPDLMAKSVEADSDPSIQMTFVAGYPDRVHLVINTLTSLAKASQIIALLSAAN